MRLTHDKHSADEIFKFNVEKGSSPHNFGNGEPCVREHIGKIETGETIIWGAICKDKLIGIITAEKNGGYWLNANKSETCFVNEFVVDADYRGKGVGSNLAKMTTDKDAGISAYMPEISEMYTTVHEDNAGSKAAFIKGGYTEVITYADSLRNRNTTVLKAPVAKRNKMRIVGIQSGNAVDGIDVGIFEFDEPVRSATDLRKL